MSVQKKRKEKKERKIAVNVKFLEWDSHSENSYGIVNPKMCKSRTK